MTRNDAIAQIAAILHRYDHPAYDTVAYCVFCHAVAVRAVEQVDEQEEAS